TVPRGDSNLKSHRYARVASSTARNGRSFSKAPTISLSWEQSRRTGGRTSPASLIAANTTVFRCRSMPTCHMVRISYYQEEPETTDRTALDRKTLRLRLWYS